METRTQSGPVVLLDSIDRPAAQQTKNYRRDLDGLRAIAVTSVVAYHAGIPGFQGGFVGVDVFFVISGYLIGAHVYKEILQDRFSIATFYQRRAKRILPALFVVLIFSYIVSLLLLDAPEMKTFAEYVAATIASASNILIWLKVDYFAPGANQNPLLMTWSLGVEEQFYLIFPLLMMFLGKMGRKKVFIATLVVTILSLILSVVGVLKYRNATFYLLPTRAWELSVGVLMAVYEVNRPVKDAYGKGRFANWLGLIGLVLLLFPIVRYSDNTAFPGLAALPPVLGAALILMAPQGWVNRHILSSQPFVFVGLISYSWYLWHWPLLSFARIASDRDITTLAAAAIAGLSLVFAWFSYRFIEQPFRKSQTPTGPLLRKYGVLCVLMLIPSLALYALKGVPQRFHQLSEVEERSGIKLGVDPCLVQYGTASPNLASFCVPMSDTRDGMALIGDSHAGALGEAFRELAEEQNLKFYEMTKGSCPTLLGVTRRMPNHPGHDEECLSFNKKALDIVLSDARIKTIWLAGYWSAPFVEESSGSRFILAGQTSSVTPAQSASNLGRGLGSTIAALKASGKRVVVLQDDPLFTFDPVRRVRAELIPPRRLLAKSLTHDVSDNGSVPRGEVISVSDDLATSIIKNVGGTSLEIFDLKKNLCDDRSCYFFDQGVLLYADGQHLSMAGSRRALRGLQIK